MTIYSKLKHLETLFLVILTVGIIGHKTISRVSLIDALYKTIIVIALAGWSIIEFKTLVGAFVINPDVATILKPQSKLIVHRQPTQILKLQQIF